MARLRIQDPENGGVALLDAMADLADGAESARGIFAFASRHGIDEFFGAPSVQDLARTGDLEIIVGISAITDRSALERLAELQDEYPGLRARAFWDRIGERLFHPKLCEFRYGTGAIALVVTSGNLTLGGLGSNYEAFIVLRDGEEIDTAELEDFLANNDGHLLPVNNAHALARAGLNVRQARHVARGTAVEAADVVVVPERDAPDEESILVVYAPKSRDGGWAQLQLNLNVWDLYFQMPAKAGESLTLQERRGDGSLGDVETRELVYPKSNQNIRVNIGAPQGRRYPGDGEGRPIVLFRDHGGRVFEYITLEPRAEGHVELTTLLEAAPDSIGRGVTRVIRPLTAVRRIWPGCPW